ISTFETPPLYVPLYVPTEGIVEWDGISVHPPHISRPWNPIRASRNSIESITCVALPSFCHLAKQRLINGLAEGVNEGHGWPDDPSPDYRPTLRVFTGKAH